MGEVESQSVGPTYSVYGGQGLRRIYSGVPTRSEAERLSLEFEVACMHAGLINPSGRIEVDGRVT